MMVDVASQVWVTVFGLSALLCMQTHRVRVRRMGVVLGLIGQPAWYIQLVIHEQWGMLPVFVGYTGVWLFGAWNLWISPRLGPLIDPLGEARHAVRGTSNDLSPHTQQREGLRMSKHPISQDLRDIEAVCKKTGAYETLGPLTLREIADELDRMHAIIEKLPKTADGVTITPGMRVWFVCPLGGTPTNATVSAQTLGQEGYSTRAAAEAARATQ